MTPAPPDEGGQSSLSTKEIEAAEGNGSGPVAAPEAPETPPDDGSVRDRPLEAPEIVYGNGSGPSPASDDDGFRATRATRIRARRGQDYRLRGLDLDAPPADVPPVVYKKRGHHPARRRRVRLAVLWAAIVVVAALVTVLLRATVVQPYTVSSSAMMPTLHVGDRILVVKSRLLTGPITTGDIVVFHHPSMAACGSGGAGAQDLVQRVIALPGQTIWSEGGGIYINGKVLNEPGWFAPASGELGSTQIVRTTIPPGDYYVLGDNRSVACDSRSFGALPASAVEGKVVAVVMRGGHPHVHLL
jgi:signal peptidase I